MPTSASNHEEIPRNSLVLSLSSPCALWLAVLLFFLFFLPLALPAQRVIMDDRPTEKFEVRLLGEKEEVLPRQGPLKVLGLDDRPQLREEIEQTAFEAREIIRRTTRVDWEGTALVVWIEEEGEFLRRTGKAPEFTAAAANAQRATVWINSGAWRRSTHGERLQVMTHELGHLLVGNMTRGRRLPLWAEEGIVMHLADEWNIQRSFALSRAHAFGQTPSLQNLESAFPSDSEGQALAYSISYLATEQIARNLGDDPGTVARLMRRLADDVEGPIMIERLWNDAERAGWEAQVRESMGSRVNNFLIMLSSGTALWFIIMILMAMAWWKKRQRRLAVARMEQQEEAWARSLTEQDIQEIYGDREERFGTPEETPWEKWEREQEGEEERM